MTWKSSDLFIFVFSVFLSQNLLFFLFLLTKKFAEKGLDKRHLNYLYKFILLYMPFFVCVTTGYTLYTGIVHKTVLADSEDFLYYHIIGSKTLSIWTELGNFWFFLAVLFIWIGGVIYFSVSGYIREKRFLKILCKCSTVSCDEQILKTLKQLTAILNLKKAITVYTNNVISTPFITGYFKIKLFIPDHKFSEQELYLILNHELIHCRNNDYFFRRLLHHLHTLFWFNPAINKITALFLEINEMACDEAVLKNASGKMRAVYAHLIIRMAETSVSARSVVALTGCADENFERRIINIMKKTNKNKKVLFAGFITATILMCPITAIAATNSLSGFQDLLVEKIESPNSIAEQPSGTLYTEYEENIVYPVQTVIDLTLAPRGNTTIDCTIDGKEQVITDTLNLSKGDKVHIWLAGDDTTDKFHAGLLDSASKKTYVSSSKGEIDHTFTVKKTGEYRIFIEGKTNHNMHISGTIFIKR